MTWFYDDDGMLVSQIRLEPEDAPLFKSALDAAMPAEAPKSVPAGTSPEKSVPAGTSPEKSVPAGTLSQRRADAFVAMVESFLTNGPGSRCGGERNMINLRLDAEALAGGQGFCEVDGVGVSVETAQRLSCDASVVLAIYGADGEPLDVGRRTRTWPTAIRRALELRDECCVFPGCTNRIVDGHHIVHWIKGGPTSLDNGCLLCRRHHRAVHEGRVRIEVITPGRFRFFRPDGIEIVEAPAPPSATAMWRRPTLPRAWRSRPTPARANGTAAASTTTKASLPSCRWTAGYRRSTSMRLVGEAVLLMTF